MDKGRKEVAAYINADPNTISFVANARLVLFQSPVTQFLTGLSYSDGINALMNVACRSKEDLILRFSFAYPMVRNTATVLESEGRCSVWIVPVSLPCRSSDDIVQALAETLKANPGRKVSVAIMDHIVSVPGIILPVVPLAQLLKKYGVARVLVDAAHAIGQIPIDMKALHEAGVDYYVTNAHKWLYAPKGCAIMVARDPANVAPLRPLVVGSEYTNITQCNKLFDYVGTKDYTAYCALSAALAFRKELGDAQVFYYLNNLAIWAGHYLAMLWRTSQAAPDNMTGAMVNVRLPTKDRGQLRGNRLTGITVCCSSFKSIIAAAATELYNYMARKKNTSISFYPLDDGTFWIRVCAQVWLILLTVASHFATTAFSFSFPCDAGLHYTR